MARRLNFSILEVVGSPLCVASEDGQRVFERIATVLKEGLSVTLSFKNVRSLTSAFLNAAIGQLYGAFGEETVRAHLRVGDLAPEDRVLLKRVVDTAKEYFKEPKRFERAREALAGSST